MSVSTAPSRNATHTGSSPSVAIPDLRLVSAENRWASASATPCRLRSNSASIASRACPSSTEWRMPALQTHRAARDTLGQSRYHRGPRAYFADDEYRPRVDVVQDL